MVPSHCVGDDLYRYRPSWSRGGFGLNDCPFTSISSLIFWSSTHCKSSNHSPFSDRQVSHLRRMHECPSHVPSFYGQSKLSICLVVSCASPRASTTDQNTQTVSCKPDHDDGHAQSCHLCGSRIWTHTLLSAGSATV